jgi:hypothetical protein
MGDARRYNDLAIYARAHGYARVTGSAIQQWVKRGLVPRATWIPWGFQMRSPVYPVTTGNQLLAACALRFDGKVRSLDMLGLALWMDGWAVPTDTVRAGLALLASGPRRFVELSRAQGADAWDVANMAVFERGFGGKHVAAGMGRADLASGMGDLVAMLAGDIAPEDAATDGLEAIGALIGLDRAASDRSTADGPWLPTPPADALRQATSAIATRPLLIALALASDDELRWALSAAKVFRDALLRTIDRFGADGDADFAGFGPLAPVLREPMGTALVMLAMLASPVEGRDLIEALAPPEHARTGSSRRDQRDPRRRPIIRMT